MATGDLRVLLLADEPAGVAPPRIEQRLREAGLAGEFRVVRRHDPAAARLLVEFDPDIVACGARLALALLGPGSAPESSAPSVPLTPRQSEVLQLLADGLTTREIAGRLGLSVKTIETHRAQLMKRLGIRTVAGLVRYALRIGVVRLGG